MPFTPTLKKPEYRAFFVSAAVHFALLLLAFFSAGRDLSQPLAVSIIVVSEEVPEEAVPEEFEEPATPRKQKRRAATARQDRRSPKHTASKQRDEKALSNPWGDYERHLFSRRETTQGSDSGKTQAPRWGSETTGRTEKRREEERVVVPPGSSRSATRWKKGAARRLISLPAIDYPESVRRKSGQGTVELMIEVDARGQVENVEILKSSGITRLDINARNAYRRAVFSPSATGSSATGIVLVTFRMRDN